MATLNSTTKLLMAQCKRVQRVERGSISSCVDSLLERKDLGDIAEFILAVTADIEHDRKLIDEWHSATKRLAQVQVQARLWDFRQIEEMLRVHPVVVSRFFGHESARRFCVTAIPLENWPTEYRRQTLWSLRIAHCDWICSCHLKLIRMFPPRSRLPALISAGFLSPSTAELS